MGVASSVFWIMLGLVYILYEAFKAEPDGTSVGVLTCVIIAALIIVECLIIKYGTWYAALVIPACVFTWAYKHISHGLKMWDARIDARNNVYSREPTAEEIEQFALEACDRYPARFSNDPSSRNYWRNDEKIDSLLSLWQAQEVSRQLVEIGRSYHSR